MQRNFAFALPICATAWLATVPEVLTTSSVLAVVGLVVVFGWAARSIYLNGQPQGSVAQLLHETEQSNSRERPRDVR